jgi:ubiquitin C-terminal hydrolase
VGLSNQGATCYLNSLLQALYMTAEIRMGLYKWVYNSALYEQVGRDAPCEACRRAPW